MINQLDIHKILDQELTFLGWAIVKHAVDLHGGKITFNNGTVGVELLR